MVFDPFSLFRDCCGFQESLSGLEEDGEGRRVLGSIERTNLIIVVLMTAGSLLVGDYRVVTGVLTGGGLMAFNFRVMRRIFEGGLGQRKGRVIASYVIKFVCLVAIVGAVLLFLRKWIAPLAFAAGVSSLFLAFWIEAVRNLRRKGNGSG